MREHAFVPPDGEWAPTHAEERCAYREGASIAHGVTLWSPCTKTAREHGVA